MARSFLGKSVKILHIITGLLTGGTELALYSLLAGKLGSSFENMVISLMDEGEVGSRIVKLGFPVQSLHLIQGRTGFSPSALFRLRQTVKRYRPDVIQGWMYHGNLAATAGGMFHRSLPVVWNIRQSLYDINREKRITRLAIQGNRLLSCHPQKIIYNSILSRQQHEQYGFKQQAGTILYNGFNTDKFKPNSDTGRLVRSELNIPRNALVIGHIGRFHQMKDHKLFLESIEQIMTKREDVHVIMIGAGVDKNNSLIQETGNIFGSHRLHLMGRVDCVEKYMTAMDLVCQSSWSEAFPNVIGEAMASGVPCVVTDVGESATLVGTAGIVVPPENQRELTQALTSLLNLEREGLKNRGKQARLRIKERFSIDTSSEKYCLLYKQITKECL